MQLGRILCNWKVNSLFGSYTEVENKIIRIFLTALLPDGGLNEWEQLTTLISTSVADDTLFAGGLVSLPGQRKDWQRVSIWFFYN